MILDDMITNNLLPAEKRFTVRSALLLKHVHQVCLTFILTHRWSNLKT